MDIVLDPLFVALALGTVLPILVGLVTKKVAHSGLKAVLLAFLSAATGVLAVAQENEGLVSQDTVIFGLIAWVTAVSTHYGILKPTGVSDKVQDKTANLGVGG